MAPKKTAPAAKPAAAAAKPAAAAPKTAAKAAPAAKVTNVAKPIKAGTGSALKGTRIKRVFQMSIH